MSVQSEAIIAKMKEERAILLAEAEAYAKRKNADTTSIVEKMKVIQAMMKDFYQFNNSNMTSEDFSKVITEIVMVLCQYFGHKKSNFFMLHF